MNSLVALSVSVPFVIFVAWIGLSLFLANRRNNRLCEQAPGALPYTWGYFLGYSGIFFAILVCACVTVVAVIFAGLYRDWLLIVLAYAVLFGIASYGVLTRKRWGWMFQIPLSLNPGFWAFNSVYASNRWQEF